MRQFCSDTVFHDSDIVYGLGEETASYLTDLIEVLSANWVELLWNAAEVTDVLWNRYFDVINQIIIMLPVKNVIVAIYSNL